MKKAGIALVLCVVCFVFSYVVYKRLNPKTAVLNVVHFKYFKDEYYYPVSFIKLTESDLPCIPVEIEDRSFSMVMDLGFRGELSIHSRSIDCVPNKSYVGTQKTYGFRGIENENKLYLVPKISIGKINIHDSILHESSDASRNQSSIVKEGCQPTYKEVGRVGWELFQHVNLFIDVKNSKIAFCDSLKTLNSHGYLIENYVKVPLLIDRGLIEFQAKTPNGWLRCVLDTGCTLNFFHSEIESGKTVEQVVWDPDYMYTIPSFRIGDMDIGQIEFHRLPIKLPIHVDAMLGMEFFEEHLVFIDFFEQCIYFAKSTSDVSETAESF